MLAEGIQYWWLEFLQFPLDYEYTVAHYPALVLDHDVIEPAFSLGFHPVEVLEELLMGHISDPSERFQVIKVALVIVVPVQRTECKASFQTVLDRLVDEWGGEEFIIVVCSALG